MFQALAELWASWNGKNQLCSVSRSLSECITQSKMPWSSHIQHFAHRSHRSHRDAMPTQRSKESRVRSNGTKTGNHTNMWCNRSKHSTMVVYSVQRYCDTSIVLQKCRSALRIKLGDSQETAAELKISWLLVHIIMCDKFPSRMHMEEESTSPVDAITERLTFQTVQAVYSELHFFGMTGNVWHARNVKI